MKNLIVPVVLCALWAGWPNQARAEWFYGGVHLGGQYLDLDTISGGQVFDQAVERAWQGDASLRPEPTRYTGEAAFVWGGYLGVSLGRFFRLGGRLTHSWMDVRAENGLTAGVDAVQFELSLLMAVLEAQLRIPIWIFNPFIGLGVGYGFLKSDTKIISSNGLGGRFEGLGTNCLDAMAAIGLDVNLGRWFSLGAAVYFNFLGLYYESPSDSTKSEAAWGLATDYLLRATLRL